MGCAPATYSSFVSAELTLSASATFIAPVSPILLWRKLGVGGVSPLVQQLPAGLKMPLPHTLAFAERNWS